MTPEILTRRLRLNSLTPDDAHALFTYRSHEDVTRFQGWCPAAVDDARGFIARNAGKSFNQHESWYQLAIRSAATGELLGDFGIHFVGDDGQQVEIGFTIRPASQHQGLGAEAVTAVLDYMFTARWPC